MTFCSTCGKETSDGANYCVECGNKTDVRSSTKIVSKKVSVSLQIALYIFWPVMIYLGHKAGKTKFYIMIVIMNIVVNFIVQLGLAYLGVPWFASLFIPYLFYLYFARRLIKELKNT